MYRQIILLCVLINFVSASALNLPKYVSKSNKGLVRVEDKPNTTPQNVTYFEKTENMIRLPAMNIYEERKSKRKTPKKLPRRTIQKFIKKNKSKMKKMYIIQMTSYTTIRPKAKYEDEDSYSPRKEEATTQYNQKRRPRKLNSKLPRNPMPFHQMQMRKNNYKRNRRDNRDLFILKDFDEIEFLKEKKDYNVVNANYKKYW